MLSDVLVITTMYPLKSLFLFSLLNHWTLNIGFIIFESMCTACTAIFRRTPPAPKKVVSPLQDTLDCHFYVLQCPRLPPPVWIEDANAITTSSIKLMQLDKVDATILTPQPPPAVPLASQLVPPSVGPLLSHPSSYNPQSSPFFTTSFYAVDFLNLNSPLSSCICSSLLWSASFS